jgi:hypothetical protein
MSRLILFIFFTCAADRLQIYVQLFGFANFFANIFFQRENVGKFEVAGRFGALAIMFTKAAYRYTNLAVFAVVKKAACICQLLLSKTVKKEQNLFGFLHSSC